MDPVSKASFGLNETLRIIIPGYYSLALLSMYLFAFDRGSLGVGESFPALMIGLALGFFLYSVDYPTRRKPYNRGLPSDYLRERSKKLATELKKPEIELESQMHIGLYLYILNNFLSETFHEVVIVRGSLYYCVTYVWLISGILGALGLVAWLFCRFTCLWTANQTLWVFGTTVTLDQHRIGALLGCSVIQLLIFFLLRTFNRMDRTLSTIYKNQIDWLKLNDPLVEYLLVHRIDPQAYGFLKPPLGEQVGRDKGT